MENLDKIINYISVSLVPIIGCIITVLTYINTIKSKKIDSKINQQNQHGDNIHYEDNRKSEINIIMSSLQNKQEQLNIFQQNIDDTSKFISKYSGFFLIFIYGTNVFKILFPLPNLPVFVSNISEPFLLKFIATSLYQAVLPTIINILILIIFICIVLAIKSIIFNVNFKSIFVLLFYSLSIYLYFECFTTIKEIPITKIQFNNLTEQSVNLMSYLKSYMPFYILLTAIILWGISTSLISILFETNYTKPNLKLFRIAIPRFGFYLFLIIVPILITLATVYI
ncbi:hypothetical protein [Vagococcus fluvialis]|uniref:Uncharacterized protein n=1 Tax=Vagococcus fluvialis TaxID=2738 RepID=A0A7X6D9W6_9ENTE|nr:hypothetical protein [Vagococcus fluvialis]NKC68482.1 hypothetical protein [Vagococcus fluvialis]